MNAVYAAVLLPPFEASETIKIFKQGLESVIGKFPGYRSDPAITLFVAMCDETKAALIEKKLEIICRNQLPFDVQFHHFDEFQANKTVIIPMGERSKEQITKFRKKIAAEIKESKFDEDVDFNIGRTPHITIGRSLTEDQYKVAKKYFNNRKFDLTFECKSLVWRVLEEDEGVNAFHTSREFPFAQKNLSLF